MAFSKRYNRYQIFTALVFLAPMMLILLGFSYYPALRAVIGSFTKWNGFDSPVFVGLRNYITLFGDRIFLISLRNVLYWSIGSMLVIMIAPFIGAELMFSLKSGRAQYVYRVLFIIPMVVPSIVTIMIWTFIYDPVLGILNRFLTDIFHIPREMVPNWLGDPRWVIPSLIFIGFPWLSGMNLLIYFSGLQDISLDVLEYAMIDGCTGLNRIVRIHLPLIMGQVRLLFILGIIGTLQNLTVPLLMTDGGPGYDSYVPGLYMYVKAFRQGDFGMSLTIATFMFIVIFILTLVSRKFGKLE
jgi:raffinose/stachyose/melibiose transport system permease protein